VEFEQLTRAISIRQPFVELILRGEKLYEYRSRPTRLRERVYLYAAKTLNTVDGFPESEALLLPRGFILGSVGITGCEETEDGGYAYALAGPLRYEHPMIARGVPQPGFWVPATS